ncbi:MAG: TIGR01777 family oxidoreductase [Chloroflexota bacterium]
MRVIVTGGTGLIGSKLVDKLVQKNYEVVVLSRNPQKYPAKNNVQYEKWDAKTAAGWGQLADGAHAIINLAGESIGGEGFPPPRWTQERKDRILQSRLGAGHAVVEAIQNAEQKPKYLLQASAIGFYGDRGSETLTESSSVGSGFLADVVKEWEASTASVEEAGVRRVSMRIGIVYTLEGGALPATILPFRLFAGGPLGNGRQYISWVHVDDVVNAMMFLLENENASGPINITGPEPLTNAQMAKVIGKVMKRPSFFPAPGFALKLALGETSNLVLHGQKVLPTKLTELGFQFEYKTAEKALKELL